MAARKKSSYKKGGLKDRARGQRVLFDDDTPPPHSRDGTSEDAAQSMVPNAGTLRAMVLEAITEAGGLTCEEICDQLKLSGSTVRPRIWELRGEPRTSNHPRLVEDSGKTRPTRSRRDAIVWVRRVRRRTAKKRSKRTT